MYADTKVSIIMTDDDNAGWNAARSVYGSGLQQFLCTWHIQRSWIRNLHNHVKDDVYKAEVYIYLSALLNANSESDFEQYKSSLVSKLCLSCRRTSSSVGLLYDVIFKYRI
jgi:hypothetical protein